MLSIPRFFSLPSLFRSKEPHGIDIHPVKIRQVELEKDRQSRSLKQLLKLNHASHSILYHNLQFHNHMPHILGSAYLLDSNVQHLEKIYEKEAEGLEKWESSPGEIAGHDWRDFLGNRRYQRAYVDFFEDELARNGYDWRKVIDQYLLQGEAPLINNIICGLAHPIIHLGYAIELDSKEVAIEALGLTATCYDFLHKYIDEQKYSWASGELTTSPLAILEKIRTDSRLDDVFDGPDPVDLEFLFQKHEKLLLEYWNSWTMPEPKMQFKDSQWTAACLLSATVRPASSSYDFFLVHTLTSSHAVRIVLPFIPARFHISMRRPKIDITWILDYDICGRDWAWIDHAAIDSKWAYDAHFVKALRALKEAAQTWGDPESLYLKAAIKFADEFDGWA